VARRKLALPGRTSGKALDLVKADIGQTETWFSPVFRAFGVGVTEGERKVARAQLLADIQRQVKTKGVGVSAHALVDKPDLGGGVVSHKDRNDVDNIAPAVKVAENVSARERKSFG